MFNFGLLYGSVFVTPDYVSKYKNRQIGEVTSCSSYILPEVKVCIQCSLVEAKTEGHILQWKFALTEGGQPVRKIWIGLLLCSLFLYANPNLSINLQILKINISSIHKEPEGGVQTSGNGPRVGNKHKSLFS